MSKKIVVLLFIIIGLLQSCNTTEPPPPDEKLTLTLILEDASSIEAWIKLTTTNLQLPATVNLKQSASGGATVTQDIILSYADTVIYIDSLLPNTTYNFQASSIQSSVSSAQLQVTTMDTTSHNFTWQTFTFGEHSSSVLYDVAIIDENNIWAVGEIYLNDSLGQPDPQAYNAVHWDGNEWLPQKITVEFRGNMITPPLEGVFALSGTDIWFVGSLPIHGDGTNWTMYDLRTTVDPNLSLSKAWGLNSNDMYFVGRAGSIAHYSGPTGGWQKIESGTELDIYDIWGDYNEKTSEWEILAVASNYLHSLDRKILKVEGNSSSTIADFPLNQPLRAVWFKTNKQYYVTGSGIYQKHQLKDKLWQNNPQDITTYSTYAVRGNDTNDVIGVGAFGDVIHFNGKNWKTDYQEPLLSFGAYYGVAVKGNTVIAVGTEQSKAVITIGKK